MGEMTTYDHGRPSWIDIGLPDPAAGISFYAELFGWAHEDLGEDSGHYTMMKKDGRLVAAISGSEDDGPPHWAVYVNVDNVDDVTARVTAAGGTVVVEPMDIFTEGRMAVYQDTTGAHISAWQAGNHTGAQLVEEPGAVEWFELMTRDMAKSQTFYGEVFGWGWGGDPGYAAAQVGGRGVAGVTPRREGLPDEVPDHWLVYFGTTDVDGDTARVAELGGRVLAEPMSMEGIGRFSAVMDPQGAPFGLFTGQATD